MVNRKAYQERYVKHQARKKSQITESVGAKVAKPYDPLIVHKILSRRRSQRVFSSEPIADEHRDKILASAMFAPNSCNRHGICMKVVRERRDKELLGGLLVGGVGWVHRADTIVLFLADPIAYASPNEKEFMHYCDVGFKAMTMWLTAESYGIGACYINPNLVNREVFMGTFGTVLEDRMIHPFIFCGALALGNYEKRALPSERPSVEDSIL